MQCIVVVLRVRGGSSGGNGSGSRGGGRRNSVTQVVIMHWVDL